MYFRVKNTLKSNSYHTFKHSLRVNNTKFTKESFQNRKFYAICKAMIIAKIYPTYLQENEVIYFSKK